MLRGKQLDEVIEQELQMMLVEGFDKSPISHKSLHDRLTARGYISGGLSTLSSVERKKLITRITKQASYPLCYHEQQSLVGFDHQYAHNAF